jgi:hypothetical protein
VNNRRKLVIALGAGALAAPFGTFAQQADKTRRIGVLMGYAETDPEHACALPRSRRDSQC